MEDFFFGVPVIIETAEENQKKYKNIAPIKSLKYKSTIEVTRFDEATGKQKLVPIEYNFYLRIYKNQ